MRILVPVALGLFVALGGLALIYATHDTDGDGWSDEYEMYLPTGPDRACPQSLGDAAWPADLNNDTFIDVLNDLVQIAEDFALPVTAPNVAHREDLSPEPGGNQLIDIFDIGKVAERFGQTCTP